MTAPRVSILMATYNARPFLPAAVESILRQSFTDFELVIVDDGSTDDSLEYLHSLTDSRIKVIAQANAGLAAALNRGLADCNGEYVARMDADDISLPDRLAQQVAFLDRHAEVGCVGTQIVPFGDAGQGGDLRLPTDHDAIHQALQEGRHAIVHASVMMRTDLVRRIGGYWPYRIVAEDYDLFLRLAEISRLATIDEVFYQVRYHMASLNGSNMLRMRRAVDYACDLARRRRAGLPSIDFCQFVAARESAPLWRRWNEARDAHARAHYRAAMAELCGRRRIIGYLRLSWAAACSPTLTLQRAARVLSPRAAARALSTTRSFEPSHTQQPLRYDARCADTFTVNTDSQ